MSNGDRKKFTQEWEIARFLVTSCSTPNGDRRKFTAGLKTATNQDSLPQSYKEPRPNRRPAAQPAANPDRHNPKTSVSQHFPNLTSISTLTFTSQTPTTPAIEPFPPQPQPQHRAIPVNYNKR